MVLAAHEGLSETYFTRASRDFAASLKITIDDLNNRSYNPAFDIALRRYLHKSPEFIPGLLLEIRRNLVTNLGERMRLVDTSQEFHIQGGRLVSDLFPMEPFGNVIERGVFYREHQGSTELEREHAELVGWQQVETLMTDELSPIGVQAIIFSPPGFAKDTPYKGRFVDIFELKMKDDVRYVQRRRVFVDFTTDEYKKNALLEDPAYFDSYDPQLLKLDAYFLSHPIVTMRIPDLLYGKGMSEQQFSELISFNGDGKASVLQFIDAYQLLLQQQDIDNRTIALTFNAIINRADEAKSLLLYSTVHNQRVIFNKEIVLEEDEIFHYGRKRVKEVVSGGCAPNRGFSLGDEVSPWNNSVVSTMPGENKKWSYHTGDCVLCRREDVPVGPCNICTVCENIL